MSDSPSPPPISGLPYDLADAFAQLPVGVAIFDTSDAFRCLRHNQRFLATIGMSGDASVLGAALSDLLTPESYEPTRAIFAQVRAQGVPFSSEDYSAWIEGQLEPRSFQWSLTPLRGPGGGVTALLASGIDITARKAFEADARAIALRALEQSALLDTLFGAAPIGIAFLDRELRFVRINERLAQLNGLPVAAHLGRRPAEILPALAGAVEPMLRQVLETGRPMTNVEASLPDVSGGGAWMKSLYPVPDAAGAIIGVGVLVTDVSEERRMQEQLRAATARERERAADLAALLDAVPAAVWIAHDPAGKVITGSRAASRMLRMEPDSNLSKSAPEPARTAHFRVLHQGVELAPENLPVQQAARGVEIHDFEEDVVFDDGTTLTLLGNATPLRDEQGQVRGAVGAFLDITDRKRIEQEYARSYEAEQQARAEAEAALKIRDTFFSMAAHELKTPLTALFGQIQLLERRTERSGALEERDQLALKAVVSQAARLNKLIDAMLDLTRIERGYLSLDRGQVDIAEVARRVFDEIRLLHPRHQLQWSCPQARLLVMGDGMRLEQVLYNLIENAVKYSPQGGEVYVRVEAVGNLASISVRDQGIGIPSAEIPHLFERFYRAESASKRHIVGMGIGLYIVQQIVALHGGAVRVESIEGEGSTFLVTLPLPGENAES